MGYVVESRYNPMVSNEGTTQSPSRPYNRQQGQSPAWTPTGSSGQTSADAAKVTTPTAGANNRGGMPDYGSGEIGGFPVDGDAAGNQNSELNYESVVVLNNANNRNGNTYETSTVRGVGPQFNNNHQMTVTSLDSTTPAGKVRKMKKEAKRLIYKDGNCNVSHCNIQERRRKYLADLFTTLIDIRWRWSFFIFFSSFVFR